LQKGYSRQREEDTGHKDGAWRVPRNEIEEYKKRNIQKTTKSVNQEGKGPQAQVAIEETKSGIGQKAKEGRKNQRFEVRERGGAEKAHKIWGKCNPNFNTKP